ncbi:MAG TPA: sigma-54 dependent transcriptional regulator [Vicinamibacteria bacterium]|nr:sigma-54 dependent transcriptional regulator [Vicinamibacteria bacterium]
MILVVDDDASVTASLGLLLRRAGYAVRSAASPAEALAVTEEPSLVLQDMNFSRHTSGEEGLALLRELKGRWPHVPVVLMTAWGSIPLAVEGMKAGGADFVTKPWTNAQLLQSVRTALGLAEARPAATGPAPEREELDERCDFGELVGEDPRLLAVLEVVARIAPTDASVLVTGESGSGKELVAEAIHRNSRRQGGPFVKVNLGGIATPLFESEMFGHVRGAFTDARADRKGRFEMADGGTVFLDEIGEVEPSAQVKLLRVLQDRTYEALGSSTTQTVDVRIVSATNRDLGEMVARGQFREDLLYRLNLISVHLPPLRERPGDIPLLVHRFLSTFAQAYGRESLAVSPAAMRWLQAQPWPGNVRQLRQWVERAVIVSRRDVLEPGDLEATAAMEGGAGPRDALPPVGSMTLDEIERAMIVKSLKHHQGNLTRVAESLGMSRPALYRRLEKYGIEA